MKVREAETWPPLAPKRDSDGKVMVRGCAPYLQEVFDRTMYFIDIYNRLNSAKGARVTRLYFMGKEWLEISLRNPMKRNPF